MTYALLKILHAIYFGGIGYSLFMTLSKVSFSRMKYRTRVWEVIKNIGFGIIWPLALFSANGRKRLNIKTKGA